MMGEIDLERLGLHVIKRAIKDALLSENLKNAQRLQERLQIKQEAIEFLTTPNHDLEEWCLKANLDYGKVLEQTIKIKSNPSFWKNVLKQLDKLENVDFK